MGRGSLVIVTCAVWGLTLIARADDHVAEVEGAGDGGGDDRQAERRAVVGAGYVDLPFGWRDGFGSEAGADARVPDQAFRTAVPWEACGSGQGVTEESSAAIPAGRHRGELLQAWSPSGCAMFRLNGVSAPAVVLVLCALNPGANGSEPDGHAPPPRTVADRESGIGGHRPADRARRGFGSRPWRERCLARVGAAERGRGQRSAGSAEQFERQFFEGTCGVFLKVVVACRVFSFRVASPASLTSTPETGSSATMYSATSESNGFWPVSPLGAGAARYTAPSSSWGSSGVLMCTSPTLEASGQVGGRA